MTDMRFSVHCWSALSMLVKMTRLIVPVRFKQKILLHWSWVRHNILLRSLLFNLVGKRRNSQKNAPIKLAKESPVPACHILVKAQSALRCSCFKKENNCWFSCQLWVHPPAQLCLCCQSCLDVYLLSIHKSLAKCQETDPCTLLRRLTHIQNTHVLDQKTIQFLYSQSTPWAKLCQTMSLKSKQIGHQSSILYPVSIT